MSEYEWMNMGGIFFVDAVSCVTDGQNTLGRARQFICWFSPGNTNTKKNGLKSQKYIYMFTWFFWLFRWFCVLSIIAILCTHLYLLWNSYYGSPHMRYPCEVCIVILLLCITANDDAFVSSVKCHWWLSVIAVR